MRVASIEAFADVETNHYETPLTYNDVLAKFRNWLWMPDDVPLKVILAVVLTSGVPGDPLWFFLVGPPGNLKTELLRTLGIENDFALMVTNLTAKSLLSGLSKEEGGEDLDLLPKLHEKTLVIRDFTTILSKRWEQVSEIFGRLRTYFDGEYSDNWGSIGTKVGKSHFNILAATTGEIDRYYAMNQKLGERFLKIRIDIDEEKAAERAARNAGREDVMREELHEVMRQFLNEASGKSASISDEVMDEILVRARSLAILRTPVPRDKSREVSLWPQPEGPARLVKQLIKLAKGLAIVSGKSEVGEEELAILERVVWDTTPPLRCRILATFHSPSDTVSFKELRGRTRLPKATLSRELEDLRMIGLMENDDGGYSLGEKAQELFSSVETLGARPGI